MGHGDLMRWAQLFSDLDAQFDAMADAEMMAELADRERVAVGAVATTQRLAGSVGALVRVRTVVGAAVAGTLRSVGPDWLLLHEAMGRETLLAVSAVAMVEGLSAATAPAATGGQLRLTFRHALRGLVRDRSPVALVVPGGVAEPASPFTELTGTIDRIGADFLELAVHAPWEPRRAASVRSVVLVPLPAVVLVRALPLG